MIISWLCVDFILGIVEVRLAPDKEALVIAQATSSVALVFTVVALVLNSIFIPMFNSRKNVSTAHRTALVVVCFLAGAFSCYYIEIICETSTQSRVL